jgi:hypothetical protein
MNFCPSTRKQSKKARRGWNRLGRKRKKKRSNSWLEGYGTVFAKPSELFLPHSHDHLIILQKEASPVNVKPYRYPIFQKTEIEEQVREMLGRGII